MTALAAYAGTGIGHYEMITYTYWCVEKGYARKPVRAFREMSGRGGHAAGSR
ncbi:MAG: hypothetical protein Ct9H300mP1_16200 [Planctomycetaceae bacterium]|nr:MAG: hypothetical protein Ct9H300mP1_16200 [Planctomycetaceae bacterium]